MKARRAKAKVTLNSKDISDHIIDFSYTDNYDQTDDISLTLEDRENSFISSDFPDTGDIITAEIEVFDWNFNGDNRTLPLGDFEVDNINYDNTLSINAVAVPITSSCRSEKKNEVWADINLSAIAGDIAGNASVSLLYDTGVDPFYDHRDQNGKSDLQFLEELCKSDGLCLKVTKGQLIVFEEAKYEAETAVATIKKGEHNIIGYPRFSRNAKDIYKACEIKYFCQKTNETYVGYFEVPNAPEIGHILKLREDYNSESDDMNLDRKARARCREKNKYEWQCDLNLKGDIIYFSGTNIDVEGFYVFDGKYHIATATHSINNSGYRVSLDTRRCLEGY